jgi:two-component system, OmpR family, KDP operon response regulator KdpE
VTHATHQILIIEDEPAIRNVLRVVLAKEGYKLIEAETGARAEIEARSHKPDLLLVDLGLPDTDGLARTRARNRPIPASTRPTVYGRRRRRVSIATNADTNSRKPICERSGVM